MKALAKRLEDRYQSAAAMRSDIERYLAGRPVQAPVPVPMPDPDYPSRGRPSSRRAADREHRRPAAGRRTPRDDDDDRGRPAPACWSCSACWSSR